MSPLQVEVKMTDWPTILGSRSHVHVFVGDPPLLHSKTGSRITLADYAVEAGFEILILLSLPAHCQEGRHILPHPAFGSFKMYIVLSMTVATLLNASLKHFPLP